MATHASTIAQPPVWFLDVDGTLSPLSVKVDWDGAYLYPAQAPGAFAVPYDPKVLGRIQTLHVTGQVEVCWLTTWTPAELEPWHDLGFGPFLVAETPPMPGRRWWKARVVEHAMATQPARRFVWSDDDLRPGHLRGLDRRRLLSIRPDCNRGLTPHDLDQIESWLGAASQPADAVGQEPEGVSGPRSDADRRARNRNGL